MKFTKRQLKLIQHALFLASEFAETSAHSQEAGNAKDRKDAAWWDKRCKEFKALRGSMLAVQGPERPRQAALPRGRQKTKPQGAESRTAASEGRAKRIPNT